MTPTRPKIPAWKVSFLSRDSGFSVILAEGPARRTYGDKFLAAAERGEYLPRVTAVRTSL